MAAKPDIGTVLRWARELEAVVLTAVPKNSSGLSLADFHTLGMLWRTLRLAKASLLLTEQEMPEEAMFLARSLFQESLWLKELADSRSDRVALVLGWLNKSKKEEKGLIREAQSLGLEADPEPMLRTLEAQQATIQAIRSSLGIRRLKNFLTTRAGASRYGRKEDYWTYVLAHEAVHGGDTVWLFARRGVGETVALFLKTNDPTILVGVIDFATASLAEAFTAASAIFNWLVPAEVTELRGKIQQAAEQYAG
jgi:hypothetical protein